MAGFANYQALRDAFEADEYFEAAYLRAGPTGVGGTFWSSSWRSNISTAVYPPPAGDPATTPGTAYDQAAGGLYLPRDLDPMKKFLAKVSLFSNISGNKTAMLVDRLVGVSGIAMNSTGNKTINSTALPRYTDGAGVLCFLEVTTAGTTTAPQVSMNSYTDQDGNNAQAGGTFTFPSATFAVNHLVGPLGMAAGDYGIQSVETINVSVAGGGSGVVNLILVKPLLMFGYAMPANRGDPAVELPFPSPYAPMPRIYDGATLQWLLWNSGAGERLTGSYTIVFG